MELGASPPPLPPVLGPHLLFLSKSDLEKGVRTPGGHEAQIKVVMSCVWFEYFPTEGGDGSGCSSFLPEDAVIMGPGRWRGCA